MKIQELYPRTHRPERVIQFGTGGFLRGFFDWMLEKTNQAGLTDMSCVMVESTGSGAAARMAQQDYIYTHVMRGAEGVEKTVVSVLSRGLSAKAEWDQVLVLADDPAMRFIVSNTTEAGIAYDPAAKMDDAPPASFPAKLTALLARRMEKGLPGFILLPMELLDDNGRILRDMVLRHGADWGLGEAFRDYVLNENIFCDTLVDRINTGRISPEEAEVEYEDAFLNASEYYHLWVISGPDCVREELPFDKAGLNVEFTRDIRRFHTRKVRILNGAHTSTVAYAMNRGIATVGEAMADEDASAFLKKNLYEEIIPSMDMDEAELLPYAEAVLTRFRNPYIRHEWRAISLNSVSKFRVRVLPSILEYEKKFGKGPENLLKAFGELIRLYRTQEVKDDPAAIAAMRAGSVRDVLANEALWGEDLSRFAAEVEAVL